MNKVRFHCDKKTTAYYNLLQSNHWYYQQFILIHCSQFLMETKILDYKHKRDSVVRTEKKGNIDLKIEIQKVL